MTRERLSLALMILALPAAWAIVFPETLCHQPCREIPHKALCKQRLKRIGWLWSAQPERLPVFPAKGVRAMVENAGEKAWTSEQILSAYSHRERIGLFLRGAWMLVLAATLWTVGRGLRERDLRKRLRPLAVASCLAVFAAHLVVAPLWRLLLIPAQGYDYVDEYVFYEGVRQDGPPDAIVGHERLDLFAHTGANVLFADGHVEWWPEHELQQALPARLGPRRRIPVTAAAGSRT